MSNPFGVVGEKFNDIAVSVTGVGQVVLGYMEHFQTQNKDKWYDASDTTVEYDSLKDALISASYANGKLTIKTLSAVEDFYRGTGRMDGGRTIFYEGKFRSYVSECYFNVTLTEQKFRVQQNDKSRVRSGRSNGSEYEPKRDGILAGRLTIKSQAKKQC